MISAEDTEIRRELCWRTIDDINSTIRYNYQQYEGTLVALSSAIIGGSLTFLNLLFPLKEADYLPLFYVGLLLFASTIGIILFIFLPAQALLLETKDAAVKYYLKADRYNEEVLNPIKIKAQGINHALAASGVIFFVGFVLLCLFISLNIFSTGPGKLIESVETTVESPVKNVMGAKDNKSLEATRRKVVVKTTITERASK